MSVHSRLDIDRWTKEFPLSRLRAEARDFVLQRERQLPQEYPDAQAVEDHVQLMSPKWEIVVGPAAVAVNEQLRAEALAADARPAARFPVDVAVWAKGEPADRSVTKIGGLPYRPSHAAWPEGDSGQPMRFIGQLCFADSLDIVPALPGKMLLVFGDDDALLSEPERLVFEWWPLSNALLVSEVPAVDDPLAPFHAVLHRTEDWDGAIFEGTKIGGAPRFIQDDPGVPGIFVGTIGSISVDSNERYPFVNVPEPADWSHENHLMIGDMGSVYLYVGSDGTTYAASQCY